MSDDRRWGLRLPAKLLIDQYAGDEHKLCMSADLSPDGVFLYQSTHADIEAVNLEFSVPGYNDRVWAYGKVRFRSGAGPFGGTGIAFVGIAGLHQELIHDWLIQRQIDQLRDTLRWRSRRHQLQASRKTATARCARPAPEVAPTRDVEPICFY